MFDTLIVLIIVCSHFILEYINIMYKMNFVSNKKKSKLIRQFKWYATEKHSCFEKEHSPEIEYNKTTVFWPLGGSRNKFVTSLPLKLMCWTEQTGAYLNILQ